MEFEWDEAKAFANEQKHGVDFTEAMSIFADPLSLTGYDPDHSEQEDRYLNGPIFGRTPVDRIAH